MVTDSRVLDAQYAVLGSMLIDPRCIPEVMSKVSVTDFTAQTCRTVFFAIKHLFDEAKTIDPVTVVAELKALGEDSAKFVLGLMDITPTAASVMEYVSIMKDGARLDMLRELANDLASVNSLDDARSLLDRANGLFVGRDKLRRMNMEQMLLDFYERHSKEHQYLTWGFPKLDKGIFSEAGDFIVLGGYPSSGKTALAVSFAWHMAKDLRVGFYSLETNQYKIADRLVSYLTKLEMATIKRGDFSEAEWACVIDKHKEIPTRKLEIIEAGGMTVSEIRADAVANRFDFILIDYMQLIQSERRGTRTDEVSEISRSLHTMSQRDKITVFALSQLKRPEKIKGASIAPTMQDLRESGQIEQDADVVFLLYEEDKERPDKRVLKIAKNKEGTKGKVYFDFNGETQTFTESVSDDKGSASEYVQKGKFQKQAMRASAPMDQVPLTPITGDDKDLPF